MSDDNVLDAFDGEILDLVIPDSLAGYRVDRALALLTGFSRSEAHHAIDEGLVKINDHVVRKSSQSLDVGDHLSAVLPLSDEGEVAPDATVVFDVVLDDPDFVVINKPAGLVVHPGAGQREGTLVAGLVAAYPEMAQLAVDGYCDALRPGIVHRLDKGTSGLLVAAKTPRAFLSLSDQLAERTMQRTYLGLVEGYVEDERGVVDAPIGRSSRTPTLMAVRADGRPARTSYEVLRRIEKPHNVSLLRLRLDTGRTHQIRVHLGTIGHPVVNDNRYGHRRDRRLLEGRFFLHSTTLRFVHPVTGDIVDANAPLPQDLQALVPDFKDD